MSKQKSIAIQLLVVLSLLATVGCHRIHKQVRGSGVRKIEKRDVAPFTRMTTEGAFEIEVVAQKDQSLEIEADDNILPYVETAVSGSVLRIRLNGSFSFDDEIKVKISVPNLEEVSASGAGTINVIGLKNDRFEIDMTGAPTIRVGGETKVARIEADGAGKIDTMKLRASKMTVVSNGVSSVEVYASDHLDVTVSGPSHVTYAGDPEVTQIVNGPGSVTKKESSGA